MRRFIHSVLPYLRASFVRASLPALLACAIAGCAAPEHPSPMLVVPAAYAHAATAPAAPANDKGLAWWRAGELPVLDAWVSTALARNADLAIAGVRLRRAMLEARLAGAPSAPTVSGEWNTRAARALGSGQADAGSGSTGQAAVSWELDLFGRLGALQDAASFEAQASEQDRQAVRLALVASVTELYFQLAHSNDRVAMAEAGERDAERIVALVEARFQAGAEGRLAFHEALQVRQERAAELASQRMAATVLRERVRVLLDGASVPEPEPQTLLEIALPPVQPGLPAELLGRRPDLRAAQWRLQAAGARTDAAVAAYYPRIALTGALGTSSKALLEVLANPVATLGFGMTLPFLQESTLRIETDIARSRYEEAAVRFRKALYTALGEVDQALSARIRLTEQEAALRQARIQAAEAARVYEARFLVGLLPLRSWLDAQERLRTAEVALASIRLAQVQNQIQLSQVLGGGWMTSRYGLVYPGHLGRRDAEDFGMNGRQSRGHAVDPG
ncbi:efflux transporter outer membrane subunit [Variovorax atrisoli]|uniref:efflux transporter outer membrane subunit n=1 Tax=Variovorax atrisoli TaxID=3394203 RepID=UPI004040187B